MERRAHPPVDGLPVLEARGRAHLDVAVARRLVPRRRVVRLRRVLVVSDQLVLDHVHRVVVVAGVPGGVLGERWEIGERAPAVEAILPGGGRGRGQRGLDSQGQRGRQSCGEPGPSQPSDHAPSPGGHLVSRRMAVRYLAPAASGIDRLKEIGLRSAAHVSGGRPASRRAVRRGRRFAGPGAARRLPAPRRSWLAPGGLDPGRPGGRQPRPPVRARRLGRRAPGRGCSAARDHRLVAPSRHRAEPGPLPRRLRRLRDGRERRHPRCRRRAQIASGAYWDGWNFARAIVMAPWSSSARPSGWVMTGFGQLYGFGGAPEVGGYTYWPGTDSARGAVILPTSTPSMVKGYVLDAIGGIHPFGGAPSITG